MHASSERQAAQGAPYESGSPAVEAELRRLENLARLMDMHFRVPGTSFRIGLDGLIGLVPGIGDTATLLPALYIIARARGMGAPAHLQGRMAANVLVDLLIGAVPLIGDLLDIGFKANTRNVRMLREHFGAPLSEKVEPAGQRF